MPFTVVTKEKITKKKKKRKENSDKKHTEI